MITQMRKGRVGLRNCLFGRKVPNINDPRCRCRNFRHTGNYGKKRGRRTRRKSRRGGHDSKHNSGLSGINCKGLTVKINGANSHKDKSAVPSEIFVGPRTSIPTWLEVPLLFSLPVTWGATYAKTQQNKTLSARSSGRSVERRHCHKALYLLKHY